MGTTSLDEQVRQAIRPIPDHPKPGIVFQDITPVLRIPSCFGRSLAVSRTLFAQRDLPRGRH